MLKSLIQQMNRIYCIRLFSIYCIRLKFQDFMHSDSDKLQRIYRVSLLLIIAYVTDLSNTTHTFTRSRFADTSTKWSFKAAANEGRSEHRTLQIPYYKASKYSSSQGPQELVFAGIHTQILMNICSLDTKKLEDSCNMILLYFKSKVHNNYTVQVSINY